MRWCWVKPDSTDISASRPSWSTMLVTSSAISSDGSRASAAATARRCSSPPDSDAGVAFGKPVEADLGEQLVHVGGLARRQAPDDVVGDAGAQHLALRVLHDHGSAAQPTEPDRAGPFDGARGGLAAGQHQHQRRLA